MAANLTDISTKARKGIRFGIYAVILYFIGQFSLRTAITVYRTFFPKPPPPPTVAFDRLPSLPFPEKSNLPSFEFKVETPSGGLPKLTTQAKVYFMPKAIASLTSFEDARKKAVGMGFSGNGTEVNPTVYSFPHAQNPSKLEINIVNGTFSISYNLASDPVPLEKLPPTPESGVSLSRSFLSAGGITPIDLTGMTTHEFLRVQGQSLATVSSLSEAQLTRVNLFRKNYDELPAKTPNINQANVWFILSGESRNGRQIIASEYHYFPIDETQVATYPIKTAQTALENLQTGKGFIANLGDNTDGKVTIRRIYLAYYDAGTYTEFYQPIIVFEGDRGFVGYVPAVADQYYGN